MKNKIPLILFGGIFLFGVDQWLKWQARHAWSDPALVNRFFGWSPFNNPGVAFSLPVPGRLAVIITIPIICIVGYLLMRGLFFPSSAAQTRRLYALALILTGAISNLADRIVYYATVDYWRIFTGVINLADVLIVLGFVVYFLAPRKQS
ncbi:MAG: signal peptidase II [Candidatus Magasanikbacteria bacterium]|nr:signal peptidase II [Candidatus Magasanikbacteria bacterium]